jgi:hypothetical protein
VVEIGCVVRISGDMPSCIQFAALPYAGRGLRHRLSELIVNEVHWTGIDGYLHSLPDRVVKIRGRAAACDDGEKAVLGGLSREGMQRAGANGCPFGSPSRFLQGDSCAGQQRHL